MKEPKPETRTCWICHTETDSWWRDVFGRPVCTICWHAIERRTVATVGKELRDGLKAMKGDEK